MHQTLGQLGVDMTCVHQGLEGCFLN
jgi:hypothetical protein